MSVAAIVPHAVQAVGNAPEDAAWSQWSAAGQSMGTPSVVSAGSNLFMFIRGTDSTVWERTWNGSSWGGLVGLGGSTLSAPVGVVSSAANPTVVNVFVRGTDGETWYRSDYGGAWGPWTSIGGFSEGAPAVDNPQPSQVSVFVRGMNGGLWRAGYTPSGGWSGWSSLGGSLTSAPSATSSSPGRSDVVARGGDGSLWYLALVNNAPSGWQPLGGLLLGDPSITSWGRGRLDIFIEGLNTGLYHLAYQAGGWTGWESLGGFLEDGPSSLSSTPGAVDALVVGTNDAVYVERWTDSSWTGFDDLGMASLGGQILGVPFYAQVYELSCEEAALQMALGFEGIPVSQAQVLAADGVNAAPGYVSDGVLHWGDPYQYFVGNVNGSEVNYTGYGTYDTTIAKAADGFGGEVIQYGEGIPPSAAYAAVLAGHPVVAWVSFDYEYHAPGSMIAWDGRSVIWSGPVEHTLTIVGVSNSSVLVYNPWFGIQWISRQTFQQSYASYDDMAVILN